MWIKLNLIISLANIFFRLGFTVFIYQTLNLEDISSFGVLLSWITFGSFLLGLETHRYINRNFISSKIKSLFFKERVLLAIMLVVIYAIVTSVYIDYERFAYVAVIAFLEWLILENSRIFLVSGSFLISNIIGALRALLPLFCIWHVGFSGQWLEMWVIALICFFTFIQIVLRIRKIGVGLLKSSTKDFISTSANRKVFLTCLPGLLMPLLIFTERFAVDKFFGQIYGGYFVLAAFSFSIIEVCYQSLYVQPNINTMLKGDNATIEQFLRSAFLFIVLALVVMLIGYFFFGKIVLTIIDKGYIPFEFYTACVLYLSSRMIFSVLIVKCYCLRLDFDVFLFTCVPLVALLIMLAISKVLVLNAVAFFVALSSINVLFFSLGHLRISR